STRPVTLAATVARRLGVTYPLAFSRATARSSPAGRAAATSTTGACPRKARNNPASTTKPPSVAANKPNRLPLLPLRRDLSSILSELRSCCGGCDVVVIQKSWPEKTVKSDDGIVNRNLFFLMINEQHPLCP